MDIVVRTWERTEDGWREVELPAPAGGWTNAALMDLLRAGRSLIVEDRPRQPDGGPR